MNTTERKCARDELVNSFFLEYRRKKNKGTCDVLFSKYIEEAKEIKQPLLIHFFKGFELLCEKDTEGSIAKFQKIVIDCPCFAPGYLGLGYCYFEMSDLVNAKRNYIKSMLCGRNFNYAVNGLANVFLIEKKYELAEKYFNKVLEIDDKFEYASLGLGSISLLFGKYKQAGNHFRNAIKIDKNCVKAWVGIGSTYINSGHYSFAINALKKAIDINPNLGSAWFELGNAYYDSKFIVDAIEAYSMSIKLGCCKSVNYYHLGNAYYENQEFEKAIEKYNEAIKKQSDNHLAWSALGMAYHSSGLDVEAKDAYLKAIDINPKFSHPYFSYGVYLQRKGEFKDSINYFCMAIERFDRNEDKYWISVAKMHIDECKKEIKKVNFIIKFQSIKDNNLDPISRMLAQTFMFDKEVFDNQKQFEKFVGKEATKVSSRRYFKALRRWNSYTPIVADNYHSSKGGGYFLHVDNYGIVVDPGFNFIENFKNSGHFFDEINCVIVSHAHNDHTSDLESILTLLNKCNEIRKGLDDYENENTIRADIAKENNIKLKLVTCEQIETVYNDGSPRRKRIHFYITKSVAKKYSTLFSSFHSEDYEYHIIESGDAKFLKGSRIKINALAAKHNDLLSDYDSIGLQFNIDNCILIYTGDTGWDSNIEKQYKLIKDNNKDKYLILLAHLGGFKQYESDYVNNDNVSSSYYKQHLGRLGLGKISTILAPQICLISEFGEELREHREIFTDIYNDIWGNETRFIPVDIGFELDLIEKKTYGIVGIDSRNRGLVYGYFEPDNIKTCLVEIDYSLHYFDKSASLDKSKLVQLISNKFSKGLL